MKNILLTISLVSFFLIANSNANCQDSLRGVNFRVINEITGHPVELAHVINQTQRQATISDLLGYFKISLHVGDTITISSLGYIKQEMINLGQFGEDSIYYTVRLKPRIYELKELTFTWFATYEKFLKGFLNLQLPVTKEDRDIARISNYFKKTIASLDLINMPQTSSGSAFGKDWLARQNELLKQQLEKEKERRAIERKYSYGIVAALTGLKGNEVFWFMEYCSFKKEFLLKANDYTIRLMIQDKYKVYNQDKKLDDQK